MAFNVYRMRLLPGDSQDDADPFSFCHEEKIIGVGHKIYMDRSYETLDDVKQAHKEYESEYFPNNQSRFLQDGRLDSELRYILEEMEEGDYVWVNRNNTFGLCKVTGDWEVLPNLPEKEWEQYKRNDIQNFREVEWTMVPYKAVPGFIRRQFSGSFGTITRIRDPINDTTRALIQRLFEQDTFHQRNEFLFKEIAEWVQEHSSEDILRLLGPTATEDLVLLYLQDQGWKLVGSSLSSSQAEIECEMFRGDRLGYVQVKSGKSSIDPADFETYDGTVFLFVGNQLNPGLYDHVHQIDPDEVKVYLQENVEEAPRDVLSAIQDIIDV